MSGKWNLSRRDFLRKSALILEFPYVVSSSALGKAGMTAASNRITLGCIGVGGRGTGNMQRLMDTGQVQVIAICDVDNHRQKIVKGVLARKYNIKTVATYTDFRDIIERSDIDAVSISTPDHWHALPVVEAAKAGKDIYCEKPLSLTIDQGKKMVEAVHRYGVVFQTGTQHRSEERFRRACELIRNGRLGKLHTIEVEIPGSMVLDGFYFEAVPENLDYDMWLGPALKAPYSPKRVHAFGWRWIFDYAGGCVTDWGAHHLDIAQWAMGTTHTGPVELEGKGFFPKDGLFNTAAYWRYECQYTNGVKLICFAKKEFMPGQYPNGIKFIGNKGWLFVSTGRLDAEPKSILNEQISPDEIHLYRSENHYQNFIDCIKTRRPTVAPIEQAHRSVSICHLANIALRLGRKVKWDPAEEKIIGDEQASRMLSRPMRSPWHL